MRIIDEFLSSKFLFYYASIGSHSLSAPFRDVFFTTLLLGRSYSSVPFRDIFFNIGITISQCGTTIEQHYSRRKWDEGGRKEHKVETR